MWAAIRLLRATRVFGMLFLSYLWALSWARLWPKRCDTKERWAKIHKRNARRMYNGFVRLRGVYIKLGQILSVMGTFLPKYFTEVLEGLQDEVPPQSYPEIARSFKKAFGKMPHEVFAQFDREPVAAASLGQVHEARNAAGDRLAVKILYPKVATIIKVDLKVLGARSDIVAIGTIRVLREPAKAERSAAAVARFDATDVIINRTTRSRPFQFEYEPREEAGCFPGTLPSKAGRVKIYLRESATMPRKLQLLYVEGVS